MNTFRSQGRRKPSLLAIIMAIVGAVAYFFAMKSEAATATLSWTPPNQCTDGTPIANCAITGYDALCLNMKPIGGVDTMCTGGPSVKNIPNAAAVSYVYDVGTPPAVGAIYTFAVRAKSAGGDSANSNSAGKTFSNRSTNPPTGLTIAEIINLSEKDFIAYLNKSEESYNMVSVVIREVKYKAGPRNTVVIRKTIKEVVPTEMVAAL